MSSSPPDSVTSRLHAALADRYRIESHIGQGGMAIVYRARDLKHDRLVALKLLRPDLSAVIGAERFLHEIRVIAHLQHPHLLPLFDSGEADGLLFYVMPFVDGETLRDRIKRERQLSIDEAVKITTQVASALDYAHRRGVIHRDVKPENILLHDGQAMIADFGIALAVQNAGGARITETGLSLGTPHYMSPEQASADRELDGRTDIYALGAVMYEMIAGDPPHSGPSAQAIIAKLMTEDAAPLSRARRTVPPHIEAAVARALCKLPADRYQTAAAFALALERGPSGPITATVPITSARLMTWPVMLPSAIAIAALALLAAGAMRDTAGTNSPMVMSTFLPPPAWDFAEAESFGRLSPDGTRFVFIGLGPQGQQQLWMRRLDTLDATPIAETTGAVAPFWSHDGTSVGYFSGDGLLVTKVPEGPPRRICTIPDAYAGSWGAAGIAAVATRTGVFKAVIDGGKQECTLAVAMDSLRYGIRHPAMLPDGRHVVFTAYMPSVTDFTPVLFVGDLETGESRFLLNDAQDATFVPPSTIVFGRTASESGLLWAQPFNPSKLTFSGEAIPISGVVRTMNGVFAYGASAAGGGTLIYLPGLGDNGELLTDRTGKITDTVNASGAWNHSWAQSNHWIASSGTAPAGGPTLVRYDVTRGKENMIPTPSSRGAIFPVWSPGDSLVAYESCDKVTGCGVRFTRLADGRDSLVIREEEHCCIIPNSWPVDSIIVVTIANGLTLLHSEIWIYNLNSAKLEPLVSEKFSVRDADGSPDGRWLAYTSNEFGRWEVFVRPFMRAGSAVRISQRGGRSPRWANNGKDLFFQTPDGKVMLADVGTQTGPRFDATSRPLFDSPGFTRHNFFDSGTSFDVSSDGQRFSFRMTATVPNAVLVQNWRAMLKR